MEESTVRVCLLIVEFLSLYMFTVYARHEVSRSTHLSDL